jgi:hypothetical protein
MTLSVDSMGSVFSLGFGLAGESSRDAREKMDGVGIEDSEDSSTGVGIRVDPATFRTPIAV